jgi:hypothetical protein
MGETGAGITAEDEVNMDEENDFMNKWSEYLLFCLSICVFLPFIALIKKNFPWLWEMKALISERPNLTPVGLGNSETTFDMSIFEAEYKTDGDGSKPVTDEDEDADLDADAADVNAADAADLLDADDEDDEDISIPRKRPADSGNSAKKKPVQQARKAKASKQDIHRDKKLKPMDRFADIAAVEEATNQKSLDLKKLQSQAAMARIKAKADIRIQRDKLRGELRMLEKKQEHDFRMAQLNLQITQRHSTHGLPSTGLYDASSQSSQAGGTGLFNAEEYSGSARSYSTGQSSGFDLESFGYNTPLNTSARLPTLPLPDISE